MNFSFATILLLLLIVACSKANDECEDAVRIKEFPFQTTGDTSSANPDFSNAIDSTCGIGKEAPGVWFEIHTPGDGVFLRATITDAAGSDTKFNAALFKKFGFCTDTKCLLPPAYSLETARTQTTLTWFAPSNYVWYLLHIAGVNANERGEFQLDIEEVTMETPRPSNDQCGDAEAIEVDALITGDTTGAFPLNRPWSFNATCGPNAYSRSTYYSIQGAGSPMAIQFQFAADVDDDRRMVVTVLEHCSFIFTSKPSECIAEAVFLTDYEKLRDNTLRFDTVEGKTYIIGVSGERFSDVGQFQLKVTESTELTAILEDAKSSAVSAKSALSLLWTWLALVVLR